MSTELGSLKLDGGRCYERVFHPERQPIDLRQDQGFKAGGLTHPTSEQSQLDSLNMLRLLETFF